ncbi:MAG: DUF2934 domain-containing protein [Terriglobales bacterium]
MSTNPPKKLSRSVNEPSEMYEPEELEPQIRLRAFELYQDRGGIDGHEVEDWLRAEEEITGKKARAATA